MVRIYRMDAALLQEEELRSVWYSQSSLLRREKYNRQQTEEGKLHCLAGTVLLHHALQACGILEADTEYRIKPGGKPEFAAIPDLHFSLSHSGGTVICAMAEQPVGADVQAPKILSSKLLNRFFTERERLYEDPIRLWTLKESYGKLTGEGVAVLEQSELLLNDSVMLLRNGNREPVVFYEKCLENGCRLATCCAGPSSLETEEIVINRSDLI